MTNYPLNFTAYNPLGPIEVNIAELNKTQVRVTSTGQDTTTKRPFVLQEVELKTNVEDWLENAPEAFAEV